MRARQSAAATLPAARRAVGANQSCHGRVDVVGADAALDAGCWKGLAEHLARAEDVREQDLHRVSSRASRGMAAWRRRHPARRRRPMSGRPESLANRLGWRGRPFVSEQREELGGVPASFVGLIYARRSRKVARGMKTSYRVWDAVLDRQTARPSLSFFALPAGQRLTFIVPPLSTTP